MGKRTSRSSAKPTSVSKGKKAKQIKQIARKSKKAKPAKSFVRATPKNNNPAPVAKKAPKEKKAKTVSSGPKGYTADEYQKFKEFKEKFAGLSNGALKDLLRKNLQSMSGNKDQLVYKCADGATLGRIPRCPKCFGGRPKFDHQKGTYNCSGYRDDTDYHNCSINFQKSELTRDPWDN